MYSIIRDSVNLNAQPPPPPIVGILIFSMAPQPGCGHLWGFSWLPPPPMS